MSQTPKVGLSDRVWEVFSFMKLGVALLGLISLSAAVGTVVPQAAIYSSPWFRLLLGLLSINLIVCSIQRFNSIYARTFRPGVPRTAADIPAKVRSELNGSSSTLRQQTVSALTKRKYYLAATELEHGWSFIAVKRRFGHWGSFLSHISFVILIIGALIGSVFGFKGYFMERVGSTIPIKQINITNGKITDDFTIRVNSAEDRILASGERDNWYTDLSIIENGTEVARQTLSVNHPFTFRGITFYQTGFAKEGLFTVNQEANQKPIVLLEWGENYFQAEGSDLYLILVGILQESQQETAFYQVYKGTDKPEKVQTGQLKTGEMTDIQGEYRVTFEGNAVLTGIQVKKDPGMWLIWLGSSVLLIGLMLSFYWRPVTISGILTAEGHAGKLTLGAHTGRLVEGVKTEFELVLADVKGNVYESTAKS